MKKEIGILVPLVLALVIGIGYGNDVSTTATANNVPPKVIAFSLPTSEIVPGSSVTIKANISDDNGYADISSAVLKCWGSGQTETSSDSWDHYTNSTPINTNINSTTNEYTWTFTNTTLWNHKSINGTWNCKVVATDTNSSTGNSTGTMTVGTTTGIILSVNSSSAVGYPGNKSVNLTSMNPITITHDGNININVSASGTNLTGVTNSSWKIPVGNIKYNSTYSNPFKGTNLSTTSTAFITNWARGTYDTSKPYDGANQTNEYFVIDFPLPLMAQDYKGTITFDSVAS